MGHQVLIVLKFKTALSESWHSCLEKERKSFGSTPDLTSQISLSSSSEYQVPEFRGKTGGVRRGLCQGCQGFGVQTEEPGGQAQKQKPCSGAVRWSSKGLMGVAGPPEQKVETRD